MSEAAARALPAGSRRVSRWSGRRSGDEWRWLAPDATIRLPRAHGSEAALTLRFSTDVPYETNACADLGQRTRCRGRQCRQGAGRREGCRCRPSRRSTSACARRDSFSPGALLHNADPRTLAVQLTSVVSRAALSGCIIPASVHSVRLAGHPDVQRGVEHRARHERGGRGLHEVHGRLRDHHRRRRLDRPLAVSRGLPRRRESAHPDDPPRAQPQARRLAEDRLRRGDEGPRPLHGRRPSLRSRRPRPRHARDGTSPAPTSSPATASTARMEGLRRTLYSYSTTA